MGTARTVRILIGGCIVGMSLAWLFGFLISPRYTARAGIAAPGPDHASAVRRDSIPSVENWVRPLLQARHYHSYTHVSLDRSRRENEIAIVCTTRNKDLSLDAAREVSRRMVEADPNLMMIGSPASDVLPDVSIDLVLAGAVTGLLVAGGVVRRHARRLAQ
jgi:hypothetical protein